MHATAPKQPEEPPLLPAHKRAGNSRAQQPTHAHPPPYFSLAPAGIRLDRARSLRPFPASAAYCNPRLPIQSGEGRALRPQLRPITQNISRWKKKKRVSRREGGRSRATALAQNAFLLEQGHLTSLFHYSGGGKAAVRLRRRPTGGGRERESRVDVFLFLPLFFSLRLSAAHAAWLDFILSPAATRLGRVLTGPARACALPRGPSRAAEKRPAARARCPPRRRPASGRGRLCACASQGAGEAAESGLALRSRRARLQSAGGRARARRESTSLRLRSARPSPGGA